MTLSIDSENVDMTLRQAYRYIMIKTRCNFLPFVYFGLIGYRQRASSAWYIFVTNTIINNNVYSTGSNDGLRG